MAKRLKATDPTPMELSRRKRTTAARSLWFAGSSRASEGCTNASGTLTEVKRQELFVRAVGSWMVPFLRITVCRRTRTIIGYSTAYKREMPRCRVEREFAAICDELTTIAFGPAGDLASDGNLPGVQKSSAFPRDRS